MIGRVLVLAAVLALSGLAQQPYQHDSGCAREPIIDSRSGWAVWDGKKQEIFIEAVVPNPCFVWMPAVRGHVVGHLEGSFKVYWVVEGKKSLIGREFPGQYTGWKCFEDAPQRLADVALAIAKGA